MKNCTVAIIVTFQPDVLKLINLLDAITLQVSYVVIVDNSSRIEVLEKFRDKVLNNTHWILLETNYGVAKAQNIGISWAIEQKATHVILLDQDSMPECNMVTHLHDALNSLAQRGELVSAIGPCYKDISGKFAKFVKLSRWGFQYSYCDKLKIIKTDFLISSGMLIPISSINVIGLMEEALFIDYIDTEWCLRAKSKGYETYGACDAIMTHTLGMTQQKVWFFYWRFFNSHDSFRYYYIFRNSCLLLQRGYTGFLWKYCEILRLTKLIFFLSLFHPKKIKTIWMILLGICHGLLLRTGSIVKTGQNKVRH